MGVEQKLPKCKKEDVLIRREDGGRSEEDRINQVEVNAKYVVMREKMKILNESDERNYLRLKPKTAKIKSFVYTEQFVNHPKRWNDTVPVMFK